MAINQKVKQAAILRITGALRERLESLIFSRYPNKEWATYFLFGTHRTPDGIIITVIDLVDPKGDDLDSTTAIVRFTEPYSLRAALEKQKRGLCMGVIHSHPEGYGVSPSPLDDDMDSYYMEYFAAFGKEAAYFSLIFSRMEKGEIHFSGRGWDDHQEFQFTEILTVSDKEIRRDTALCKPPAASDSRNEYIERFEQIYGVDAAGRLRNARVTIIGASGTGSPAADVLARAGVENFVLIDPQRVAKSNLERLHGSYEAHFAMGEAQAPFKVEVVRDLIKAINPKANVTCIVGNILQSMARDHVTGTDLVICCTDTNHSRTAISELAYRYLVPAIDVGVVFESNNGFITGEIGRVTFYSPGGPCAHCLELVDPWRATLELMSEEEKDRRRREAREAKLHGNAPGAYWRDTPEIPTVGHFTSMAGALAASYAIGWLTGKFTPPHRYFEFNILCPNFDYVGFDAACRSGCYCETLIGYADQGAHAAVISAPPHWPDPRLVSKGDTPSQSRDDV
jgi:molybdopterin/thiamine biosynthesis adenylyltransferase